MNYSDNLQDNNAELQEILDTINELPQAGAGGVTSWNDLEDKPFGGTPSDTLTWDGTYNPDELVADILVRISDAVPRASDLANGMMASSEILDEPIFISGEDAMAGFREDGYGAVGEIIGVVPYDGYDRGDVVFPKAGIYTSPSLSDLTITIPNYKGFITVKKLDPKYLPDWNDWEEKPFGEIASDIIVWDGTYSEDDVIAGTFVHISDTVLTVNDVANGILVGTSMGGKILIPGEELVPAFGEDGSCMYDFMYVIPHDNYGIFPKAGVYTFLNIPDLIISILTVKKIDKKYLPEAEVTGADAIPSYWQAHIEEKIETIKALQSAGGKDCFSFVLMTDIHYPTNLGKRSPSLAKKIMDECNIRIAINGGDNNTRGCYQTKEEILEENKQVAKMFEPIKDRLLSVEGNHDGSYYWSGGDVGSGTSYSKQFTEQGMFEEYYRANGLNKDVHFDEKSNAFYYDDVSNKVRYIGLNTMNVPNEASDVSEDGTAKYNKFRSYQFLQAQYDFLCDEALSTVPNDLWGVVVFGHSGIYNAGEFAVMVDVLSAYKDKTNCVAEYAGTAGGDTEINLAEPLPNNTTDTTKWVNGYRISSTVRLILWISSMKRISFCERLVRIAARSPAFSMAGPLVIRIFTPISLAITPARVVFPSPGGPYRRTWSRDSRRSFAASI
jgi:hypothetical protein